MNKKIETQFLQLNENKWFEYLNLFDDASVYQTVAFAKLSKGGNNLEQFILKIEGEVAAISLVRIVKVPIINRGIAYIRWGPLWIKKNKNNNIENFTLALKILYQEYVIKRKLILRITCQFFKENDFNYKNIFIKNGYYHFDTGMTVIIDISKEEEVLRSNLRKKWRYELNKVQKIGLEVTRGCSDDDFDVFYNLYKTMHKRKKFTEFIDVESFKKINSNLPPCSKLQIFICKLDGDPVSAMVVSSIGNTGIYLLGGSNEEGLKTSASYLLQWEVIKWLKAESKRWYNLGGIDPIYGPGVYTFKTGMGGNEVNYSGIFEASEDFLSKVIVNTVEKFKK